MHLLFSKGKNHNNYWGSCRTKEKTELLLKETSREQDIPESDFYIVFVAPVIKKQNTTKVE